MCNLLYEYSLLRLSIDERFSFLRRLGVRSVIINNELLEYDVPRRLSFRRKKGSYVNEYLPDSKEFIENIKKFVKENK
jgi:hypothetical protein